jgi:hypothetical protein
MKRFPLHVCAGMIVGMTALRAQPASDARPDWQTVRSQQLPGLELKLTLPKNHFFLRELIDGKIEITNTGTQGYVLDDLQIGRTGPIHGLQFFAEDDKGKLVLDPLAWIARMLMMSEMNGMSREWKLGTWSAMLPTVYSLRFDQPGRYELWAWTNRPAPQTGAQTTSPFIPHGAGVALVSDRISITIEPRTADEESTTMTEAQVDLAQPGQAIEGALKLNALQTPAARTILRTLITDRDDSGTSYAASMGLMAAPDPRAEGVALLDDVKHRKVTVGRSMQWLYSWLERGRIGDTSGPDFEKEHNAAFDDILKAAQQASGGSGPAYAETLWVAYQGLLANDPKWPAARAALAAHQLELSQAHKDEIVRNWFFELRDRAQNASLPSFVPRWPGEDFLPLMREALTKPPLPFPPGPEGSQALPREQRSKNYDRWQLHAYALVILANVKPDEARPIIIADLQRHEQEYFANAFGLFGENGNALPVVPMPELDQTFRVKLASKDPVLSQLIWLIAQYGTASLEPNVLAVYTPETYEHDTTTRSALVRYLKRCDPSKADALVR